ncbi:protein kinase [Streptomyces sp. A012304]|uniref:protein kinase domain-containing protein n=1 Tax=Streptomyces sp. A012304 TaxID=375446 RepID=UPI00222ED920|nr:protein kinase [Streptomyces sp. A012304]
MTFPADPGGGPCGPDEGLVPPTLFEPEPSAGGIPAPDPRGDPSRLPPSLAGRFLVRERLPRRGERTVHRADEDGRSAELRAAVFRVIDQEAEGPDAERVVKWFHPEAAPDEEVTRLLLSRPSHEGLSYVLEQGRARGAPYHVLPSHGSTDLATRLRDRGALSSEQLRALVRRLHGALTALHAAGVVHRDVKPSNLVLGDYARPAEGLVLIDYGISLAGRFPRQANGAWAGTPRYASPQALLRLQIVRPADDWWSLGMVVAEAARGRHPIEHHQPASVMEAVQAGAVELGDIPDPHVRLLCRGLLTPRPEDRWGTEEVAEWLAGGTPEVVSAPAYAPGTAAGAGAGGAGPAGGPSGVPPFQHAGRTFTEPARLGEEFDADWPTMIRRLSRIKERERLARWLAAFRPERDPERAEALDGLLTELRRRRPDPGMPIDLIGWMAPHLEPGYRGIPLGVGDLVVFAGRAADGDRQCVDVMTQLFEHRLLSRLSRRRGGEELDHVERRWHALHEQWETATARLSQIPELADDREALHAATGAGPALTAELLHLAAAPAAATRTLRERLERGLRALPARVPWFARLAERADEPVRLLLVVRLHPLAVAQARETRLARERQRRLAATDARSRHQRLVQRRLELPVVLGRAAGGALLLFFPHAFLVGLADVADRAPQTTVLLAWLLSVPSLAALLAVECWTAWYIGPLYHPRYSLFGLLSRRALPLTSRMTFRGPRGYLWAGLGLVALAATVLGSFLLAVWIWPAATVLGLLVSAVLRVRAWNRQLAQARGGGRALGTPADPGGGRLPRPRVPAPARSSSDAPTGGTA